MTKKIRVLVVPVGQPPEVQEYEKLDLAQMQALVGGGYIQMVPYLGGDVDLVCDEEGKLKDLEPNRPLWGGHDYAYGQFFFVGGADDEGESTSLTDEQITKLTVEFEL
jgi:hypothetical protein